MANSQELMTNITDIINTMQGRPDSISYPNQPLADTRKPYWELDFVGYSTPLDFFNGGSQFDNFLQIAIVTEENKGTDEYSKFIDILKETFYSGRKIGNSRIIGSGFENAPIIEEGIGFRGLITFTIRNKIPVKKCETEVLT